MHRWAVEWGGAGPALGPGRDEPDAARRRRRLHHRQPRPRSGRLPAPHAVPAPSCGRLRVGQKSGRDVQLGPHADTPHQRLAVPCRGCASAGRARSLSLVGEWTGRYHEDQGDRVPGDVQGDFTGVPMNDAARKYAEAFDVTRVALLEHQCQPYNVAHIYRGPIQFRVFEDKNPATQEIVAYRQFSGTYMQWRTIWMDGRAHPPAHVPHTHMGFSTGEWHGDILTVTTTHIKKEFYRRSGAPSSDLTTLVEHYIRHGNVLSHVMIITDPVYLTEPYVLSQEFVLMERGNQNWLYNCEYVMEVPMRQERRAVLPAGPEPVHRGLREAVRRAVRGRIRRCADDVPRVHADDRTADEPMSGIRGKAKLAIAGAAFGARCARARAASRSRPITCRATCTCWSAPAPTSPCRSARTACSSSIPALRRTREALLAAITPPVGRSDSLDRQHERRSRPHGRQRNGLAGRHDRERQPGRDHLARERARAHDGGRIGP